MNLYVPDCRTTPRQVLGSTYRVGLPAVWISLICPLLRYSSLCPLRSRAVPPSVKAPVAIALKVPFDAVLTSEMRSVGPRLAAADAAPDARAFAVARLAARRADAGVIVIVSPAALHARLAGTVTQL